MTVRTFIWGSCVSRDTFEYLPEDYELLGYVARQSWLSAEVQASVEPGERVESKFQQRMIEGDIAGNALSRIAENAQQIDLLLLDLCDERLGITDLGKDGILTRSVEKMTGGAQDGIDASGRVIGFGEPEHLERWSVVARTVRDRLDSLGLLGKTLVLAAEWALVDDEAQPSPTSFGMAPVEMNQRYAPYYEVLEELGFQVFHTGATLGAADHQWGRAPFHYHEVVYDQLVEVITANAGSAGAQSGSAASPSEM